jgi:hypothetical protein
LVSEQSFLEKEVMADRTRLNQMAKNLSALKKTIDRNEEVRKQCDAETNRKFEARFETITSEFQNEFKTI